MLRLYNLPADDLFFKWESYVINHLNASTTVRFTLDNARELKKQIQREVTASKGQAKAATGASGMTGTPSTKLGGLGGGAKRMGGDSIDL